MKRARRLALAVIVVGLGVTILRQPLTRLLVGGFQQVNGTYTTAQRVEQFGAVVHGRLRDDFRRAQVDYPPAQITLVGLKQEKQLEVWVAGPSGAWRWLRTYPIRAASGKLGPKLKEGDEQVPEGLYAIESLNPNSLFHLALRVNYPNAEDRRNATAEGRTTLGGDIMIHGKSVSVGCLAMGDEAAEDLFVLAAETGIDHINVVLSPIDFRFRELPADRPPVPPWMPERYERIKAELAKLKP